MNRDIEFKDQLTNEQLLKRFKNQFELVRYAIQLAENTIRSGREPDVWTDSQNVSFMILAEIAGNKEQFADIPAAPIFEANTRTTDRRPEPSWNDEVKAFKEDKKERKSKSKTAR
jgi:hypothetical protein